MDNWKENNNRMMMVMRENKGKFYVINICTIV